MPSNRSDGARGHRDHPALLDRPALDQEARGRPAPLVQLDRPAEVDLEVPDQPDRLDLWARQAQLVPLVKLVPGVRMDCPERPERRDFRVLRDLPDQ
jgi:hypothetical protein